MIYCNKDHSCFIYYTNEEFANQSTQQCVADLFVLGAGVVCNLNVLNMDLTYEEIQDDLENIELLEQLFSMYL